MIEPASDTAPTVASTPALQVRWLGRRPYAEALALQESLLAAKMAGAKPDELLLLEHEPVYTLGRGADENDLCGAPSRLGVPVFRVGRGGGATYHGPGQLIGYPVIQLSHHGRDVHRYVRTLEASVVATCRALAVEASVRPGSTGVWAGNGKIASIGVGVRRGITYHGIAINVATDLSYFEAIVPCRESGLRLTSLQQLLPSVPTVADVAGVFARCFAEAFGYHRASAPPP